MSSYANDPSAAPTAAPGMTTAAMTTAAPTAASGMATATAATDRAHPHSTHQLGMEARGAQASAEGEGASAGATPQMEGPLR